MRTSSADNCGRVPVYHTSGSSNIFLAFLSEQESAAAQHTKLHALHQHSSLLMFSVYKQIMQNYKQSTCQSHIFITALTSCQAFILKFVLKILSDIPLHIDYVKTGFICLAKEWQCVSSPSSVKGWWW